MKTKTFKPTKTSILKTERDQLLRQRDLWNNEQELDIKLSTSTYENHLAPTPEALQVRLAAINKWLDWWHPMLKWTVVIILALVISVFMIPIMIMFPSFRSAPLTGISTIVFWVCSGASGCWYITWLDEMNRSWYKPPNPLDQIELPYYLQPKAADNRSFAEQQADWIRTEAAWFVGSYIKRGGGEATEPPKHYKDRLLHTTHRSS